MGEGHEGPQAEDEVHDLGVRRSQRAIDLALGQGGPLVEDDPRLASEVAQLDALFGTLRTHLVCEPSGRVAVAMQRAVARRGTLLGDPGRRWSLRRLVHFSLRAAAVAALLVEGQVVLRRFAAVKPLDLPLAPANAVVASLPVSSSEKTLFRATADDDLGTGYTPTETTLSRLSSEFARRYGVTKAAADARGGGAAFAAENHLALRRLELALCASPSARHELLEAFTDATLVEARCENLAEDIAATTKRHVEDGSAETRELAFAVRALIASGSTIEAGPFAAVVRSAGHRLADRLGAVRDGDLAFALGAFADLAALHEGRAHALFAQHASRLCATILGSTFTHPSELLTWGCDAGALAEAGAVLRLAPAFGVPADVAYQARLLLLAHLEERAERLPGERPGLAAAILYGFGELVDRRPWEHRMRLWRARDFLPDGTALLHFAWSRAGLRAGWADFQRELRVLATEPSPAANVDRAGLLLALASTFAGTGAHAFHQSGER